MTNLDNTTTQDTYNGYSNYETWNVALWLSNDEGLYDYARYYIDTVDDLKEFVHQHFLTYHHFGDLDSIRELSSVNWQEAYNAITEE